MADRLHVSFECPRIVEEVVCPARWAPAPRWTQRGSAPGKHIAYAGVLVGPLHLNGELRGMDRSIKNGTEVRFMGLNDYVEPVEKWAYCSYGRDNARLLHRLREYSRMRGDAAEDARRDRCIVYLHVIIGSVPLPPSASSLTLSRCIDLRGQRRYGR
jgi:hypothetical protein